MAQPAEFSLLAHAAFALQLSLGVVFLLSVWPKLRHPFVFARYVVDYQLVPASAAYLLALLLIPVEGFLAVAFLFGLWTRTALLLATLMLLVFLLAVTFNLKRGRQVACGCFGNSSERISGRSVMRLLILLAVLLFLSLVRSSVGRSFPHLAGMVTSFSALIYLSQAAFLAAFFILMGAWLLSLPELMLIARHWRGI